MEYRIKVKSKVTGNSVVITVDRLEFLAQLDCANAAGRRIEIENGEENGIKFEGAIVSI